jgi:hypothetical protein
MAGSLFQRRHEEKSGPPTPHELIAKEVEHLKKRPGTRHGTMPKRKASLWLIVLLICALLAFYLWDPMVHAWYKYDAISAYLYLHNYGTGKDVDQLATCGILKPNEITLLNRRQGSFQDTYASPAAAAKTAQAVIAYMKTVKQLHSGAYAGLDPFNSLRYQLFIRPGIYLPTAWDCLDPMVND